MSVEHPWIVDHSNVRETPQVPTLPLLRAVSEMTSSREARNEFSPPPSPNGMSRFPVRRHTDGELKGQKDYTGVAAEQSGLGETNETQKFRGLAHCETSTAREKCVLCREATPYGPGEGGDLYEYEGPSIVDCEPIGDENDDQR